MTPQQIKSWRKQLGLSQRKFNELTGLVIQRLEQGQRQPTIAHRKVFSLVEELFQLRRENSELRAKINNQTPSEV